MATNNKNYYHLHLAKEYENAERTVMHVASFENEETYNEALKSLKKTLRLCDKAWWDEYHVINGSIYAYVTIRK